MAVGKIEWQLENKMAVAGRVKEKMAVAGRVKAKMAVAGREWQSGWAGMGRDGMGWDGMGSGGVCARSGARARIDQNRSK